MPAHPVASIRRSLRRLAYLALGALPRLARAQDAPPDTSMTFFTRHDLTPTAIAVAATGLVSTYDSRIARWTQHPRVQGSESRHRLMQRLSNATGATTLTWATIVGYGVGRLAHSSVTADVSLHLIEGQAIASGLGQIVRGVVGRARPSVNDDAPYSFHWGRGFGKFDYRAFPSLHSAAGFVFASGIVQEMRDRHASGIGYAAPALYAFAAVPGITRMYLNQHWASDVVAGAFLGTLVGARVVHYSHTHGPTRLDHFLLGASLAPGARGGMPLVFSVRR